MKSGPHKSKIINDPVHGIISLPGGLIYRIIEHPAFQRLRNIRQLGLAEYVYPGASHSRFAHSLGVLHLMGLAVDTLRSRGITISDEEEEAVKIASLLHDTGHSPFSHALEYQLIEGISHETISLLVMRFLNIELDGKIELAIRMFTGSYERKFFHELISSQIDMDRLDYLVRDSFYTGVVEGSVGADRIIRMLNVYDDHLVVDEKGIYSIEKFLIARRLMYWQVYMHKTVVSAEKLLHSILARARMLTRNGAKIDSTPSVSWFLMEKIRNDKLVSVNETSSNVVKRLLYLDDNDMIASIRLWTTNPDNVLSDLSKRLLLRKLFAIELASSPFDEKDVSKMEAEIRKKMGIDKDDSKFYLMTGMVSNLTYAPSLPKVGILSKKGIPDEITSVSDMFNHKAFSTKITKYFLCYPKELRK